MKILGARLATVAGLVGLAGLSINVGCGGSGGAGGNGGHGGAGGGSGGSAGGTGGGAGGATGGAGGAAGDATGGRGGAAGGTGGTSTDGGAGSHADAGPAAFAYYFDHDTEGFAFNTFGGPGNLVLMDAGTPPTFGWDTTVGMPDAGSLKVTATFTDYNQYVLASIVTGPPLDGTGKTIHAWVRLDAGAFSGGAQLDATTGQAYVGSSGPWKTLVAGTWTDLTLDLEAAHSENANFDPSQIVQITVRFATGQGPSGGGTFAPVSPVFHIDSITDGSGGPPPPVLSVTFDKSDELSTLSSSFDTLDGGTAPVLSWDSTVGDPGPGSVKITANFTDYGQNVRSDLRISPLANLTGKIIHAKVRLDAGVLPMGYAQLDVLSGVTFVVASGARSPLTAGAWTDIALNLTTAHTATPAFDPTQVIQITVSIGTPAGPDGGVFSAPGTLVFHVDSIVAE